MAGTPRAPEQRSQRRRMRPAGYRDGIRSRAFQRRGDLADERGDALALDVRRDDDARKETALCDIIPFIGPIGAAEFDADDRHMARGRA